MNNYKVKINNIEYEVEGDFIINQELNDKLDSGTFSIVKEGTSIDIQPFDTVLIYGDKIKTKRQIVDAISDEIISFIPEIHKYTINTMGETKRLERITLPNLKITRSLGGRQPLSVWDYIYRYCSTYLPKIKVVDNTNTAAKGWKYAPIFNLDSKLKERFEKIECPEFQWNEPTLREVLNDLMSVDDCLCIVQDNTITFYDIVKRGKAIDTSKLLNAVSTMGSADAISDLTITMKNAIGKNTTSCCEMQSLRSDSAEILEENVKFITQHPIYAINKCVIGFYYKQKSKSNQPFYYYEYDITKRIVEKNEYAIMSNKVPLPPKSPDPNAHPNNKAYHLFYERGGNSIDGFGILWRRVTPLSKTYAINYVLSLYNKIIAYDIGSATSTAGFAWGLSAIMVTLDYETTGERKVHVGKYLPTRHEGNRIFDNQSNAFVDISRQSIFEYAKANRLGNRLLTVNAEYNREKDIPNVSDYIGDKVLFSRSINYSKGIFSFQGILTDNYVLKNWFTGVNSKKRSWQIMDGKDATTRHDVTKLYVEFSKSAKNDKIEYIDQRYSTRSSITDLFVTPFKNGNVSDKIKNSIVYTMNINNKRFPSETGMLGDEFGFGYQLDLLSAIMGNSIAFTFGYKDNYLVNNYVDSENEVLINGLYQYSDEYGEFSEMNVYLYSKIDVGDNEVAWQNPDEIHDDQMGKRAAIAWRKPLLHYNNEPTMKMAFHIPHYYKDNAETILHTIQFEVCSDTKDIVVKSLYNECLNITTDVDNFTGLLWFSDSETYTLQSKKPLGQVNPLLKPTIETDENGSIHISVPTKPSTKSWCLADRNGNLLIGVNGNDDIYLNLLETRDNSVYINTRDKVRIGDSNSEYAVRNHKIWKNGLPTFIDYPILPIIVNPDGSIVSQIIVPDFTDIKLGVK